MKALVGIPAQRLFIEWLEHENWHVAKAGVRSKYQDQDLFGCLDALAFRYEELGHGGGGWDSGWSVWGCQVTTDDRSCGGARSRRKRKLESINWPAGWRISVISHERDKVGNIWRVEDLSDGWKEKHLIRFDRKALDAIRARAAEQKHQDEMDEIRARIAKMKEPAK